MRITYHSQYYRKHIADSIPLKIRLQLVGAKCIGAQKALQMLQVQRCKSAQESGQVDAGASRAPPWVPATLARFDFPLTHPSTGSQLRLLAKPRQKWETSESLSSVWRGLSIWQTPSLQR